MSPHFYKDCFARGRIPVTILNSYRLSRWPFYFGAWRKTIRRRERKKAQLRHKEEEESGEKHLPGKSKGPRV